MCTGQEIKKVQKSIPGKAYLSPRPLFGPFHDPEATSGPVFQAPPRGQGDGRSNATIELAG